MLNPCKEREPRVIDNELISKCIQLQYPKGEVGRLLHLEGIPMEDVEQISFDYLYILRIDHLWVLKSLVKLSLNNNLIEKIENLECLTNLRELDLSFNKIHKIENLEKLTNLEKITFYENLIETVENMDELKKLTVFSIGKNRLDDKNCVDYFRKFNALTSLNMAGNPCAEEADFRLYVAAFLPNLVYYEYQRIHEEERMLGMTIFEDLLKKLEKIETEINEKKFALEKELNDAELHSKMFVEYLNSGKLFENMYVEDDEGKLLLDIGEDVVELYEEYKQQFVELCMQVFEIGEKHYTIRQTEIDNFNKSVIKTKTDNQNKSINFMEEFIEKRDKIFSEIKDSKLQLEHDAITDDEFERKVDELKQPFNDLINFTWKNLMRLEVLLFEQMEEVNQTFGQTLSEMINTFTEEVQAVFTNIRAIEVTYSENLSDAAVRFMTAANVNPDEEIPDSLVDLLSDRDALNNAIAATHDIHMQTIDGREDTLVHRIKDWLEALTDQLTEDEIKRNRYKVLEIRHFLEIQKKEFAEISNVVAAVHTDELFNANES